MFAEVPGEFEEGDVFLANAVENPDGADPFIGKTDDLAPGAAEVPLNRLYARGGCMKMLLKKFLENVHRQEFR